MSHLPKLKIKLPAGNPSEDVCELEQAKHLLNFDNGVIMVDGKTVYTYDELVDLATQDNYKNKEYLEVVLLQVIEGG